jgi:hypothetical protein
MKNNKNNIIFNGILTDDNNIGKLDKFIAAGDSDDDHLIQYQNKINKIKTNIEELADLEQIILQRRTLVNMDVTKIRITFNNGYIYARTPFYQRDTSNNDIRVIVGKKTTTTPTTDELLNDIQFISNALYKLKKAMKDVLLTNVNQFENKYEHVVVDN